MFSWSWKENHGSLKGFFLVQEYKESCFVFLVGEVDKVHDEMDSLVNPPTKGGCLGGVDDFKEDFDSLFASIFAVGYASVPDGTNESQV